MSYRLRLEFQGRTYRRSQRDTYSRHYDRKRPINHDKRKTAQRRRERDQGQGERLTQRYTLCLRIDQVRPKLPYRIR